MKNTIKRKAIRRIAGIIALIAVIGFSMVACDDGNGSGGGGDGDGKASGIETLTLSGQVSMENWNGDHTSVSYSNFTGNLTLSDYADGSGSVTNGKLNYTIGTPSSSYLYQIDQDDLESWFWGYEITSSPATVRAFILSDLETNDNNGYISKTNLRTNIRSNSVSITDEDVTYVYVENDVTVNGTGGTEGPETYTVDGITITETYTTKNFTLALKAGWNAVYQKLEDSGTFTGTIDSPERVTMISTRTVSLSNPALRWVLDGYVPPITIPPASSTPLTSGQWANGSLSEPNSAWYSFPVTSGTTYRIWVDDSDNDNTTTTGDVVIYAYYSDGTEIWDGDYEDVNWDDPASFTANTNGTVYIRVYPKYSNGTYRIAYSSTGGTRPNIAFAPSPGIRIPNTVLENTKIPKTGNPNLETLLQMRRNKLRSAQK